MSRPAVPAAVPDDGDESQGTLIVAIHGMLQLHPWVSLALDDGTLEEDAFSLVVKRTVAYGLGSFARRSPPSAQWAHNDAGGDWTQDGAIRQLAWLQATVGSDSGRRLPIQPAARVLDDVIDRVGQYELTGLHAVVPVDAAEDGREALAYAAGWFNVADPSSMRHFIVTLNGNPGIRIEGVGGEVLAAAREATHGAMTIEPNWSPPRTAAGLARPLVGEQQTAGMVAVAAYRCTAREWSLDTATWVIEVFVEALRANGVRTPCLLTVSTA